MEKLIKISLDILDLEKLNMTSILNEHGKTFDESEIMMNIAKYNSGLYNLFCYYSEKDILLGYFRYNFDEEKNIIVRSIQLHPKAKNPNALKLLLYIAYRHLKLINNEIKIYAWVNIRNDKSFKLLEKLNFEFEKGNRDASKFSITKSQLISSLVSMGFDKLFTQQSHPGQFPIRVLRYNLPFALVAHRADKKEKLEKAISEGKINPKIECEISQEFGLISVNGNTKQIHINEQFLAFLWSFIYSTFVIVEEGVQTKILISGSNLWDGKIDNSRLIVKRAQDLYIWSKSLPKSYSTWPLHLPNPEIFFSAEEQYYINKVNGIYLKSITYLINHEIAHLVNNHFETLKEFNEKGYSNLTEEESNTHKTIEGEADLYAREEMIEQDDAETSKLINGLSIVLAHCASLFAIKHPSFLESNVHPDLDNRIFHSVNFLDLQTQEDKDYIFLVASISMNLFFAFNKDEFDKVGYKLQVPTEMSNPQDYFNECLKIIDEIKDTYRKIN